MQSRSAGALVFATSAAVLVLEIIAGRLMAPYVGVSIEAFTGIIGTVLAGIAVGAAVGGRLADNHDPRKLIGPALMLGGATAWLAVPIVQGLGPSMTTSPADIVLLTAASFLVPTTLVSSISPMVAKLRLESLDETGAVVGDLSAAGTIGALAGTFGTGFILIGILPVRLIVFGVGGLLVLVGAVLTFRLARTRPEGGALVAVLAAGLISFPAGTPCDHETDYSCVRVIVDEERPSGRSLLLDRTRHGYVDLDDPTHLELRYIAIFGTVTDALPAGSLDVLHVGGGAFSMVRYVSATRPGSTNLVLEIDEDLVDIGREELGLDDAENVEVRIGDARPLLADLPDDAFDLIIGDAFGGDTVPWSLTTTEAIEELDRVLRPDGVYVMNVIDGGDNDFTRAQVATLFEHFDVVDVVLPAEAPPRPYNQVLVASDGEFPSLDLDADQGVSIGVDASAGFADGARVLTDDFAPVEQLAD